MSCDCNNPAQFTKKPVTISAIQWTGKNLREVIAFTGKHPRWNEWFSTWEDYERRVQQDGGVFKIITPEGTMEASPGDWIIRGVKGEHYPCKPDIFSATYDAAVEADRKGRVPSDEDILKMCESVGFAFHYDKYAPGSGYGLQAKAYDLENFRALLSRYSGGKPAAVRCNHCGWRGADADLVRDIAADEPDDGAADVCPRCKRIGDLQDSGQPAASAEPVAWVSKMNAHSKYISDARYRKLRPTVQRWYEPYKCASCAAREKADGATA